MSYNIEVKMCAKAGYFTPAEARNYYGRYARDGITVHWWGDGTGEGNHNNIVNYIYNQSVLGNKSVNYVLSDAKITLMVNPDDVAWTSQSGNATTISVETEPQLSDEGYKKWGWLVWQLEQRYGKRLALYPHKYWYSTACPGTISLDRIRQEADKWASGGYNPAPVIPEWKRNLTTFTVTKKYAIDDTTPLRNLENPAVVIKNFGRATPFDIKGQTVVNGNLYYLTAYSVDNNVPNGFDAYELQATDPNTPPPDTRPEWERNKKPLANITTMYTLNNAKLVDVNTMAVAKTFPLDTPMEIKGETTVGGNKFYFTTSSWDGNRPTGFLTSDLKDKPTPVTPPEPEKPEWVKNLRDIDDTKYWIKEDTKLIDITTGNPAKKTDGSETILKKDSEFVASALTSARGTEFRITDYSFKNGIFNGVPINMLTLTPPGVPDVPPVPDNPDLIPKNVVIELLNGLIEAIKVIIQKIKDWKK